MNDATLITPDEIATAIERITPYVAHTPVIPLGDTGVVLKAESLHHAGSFKTRGAFNSILMLDPAERAAGVVAHSSGNHAIAVAHAAAVLGLRATIVMPDDAPEVKLTRTRSLGAEVVVVGPASSERAGRARQIADERGAVLIEPYDSRAVIAATASIAVELLAQAPRVTAIHVPISGGGLAAGVAAGAKYHSPAITVIGVEPDVAADALASRRAGHRIALSAEQMAQTIADGLRVQQVGELTWPHLEAFVDDIVTVTEDEIRAAMRLVAHGARLIAEPSGATPVASAVRAARASTTPVSSTAAILCGGNVDDAVLCSVLGR